MAHTPRNQSEKATLAARRAWCYLVLVLISFLCLFFFYVLVINSTRTHFEIQKGFSLLPGKSLVTNFRNVLADANIPVGTGIRNSLIVSACSAALSVYFSALTAYGIYAYNFRFKKAAFAIILLIMTMPTQVSALGFLQLITKMGLKNSFVPLILPSIAAPTVFFFMKQYLDASLPMEIVEAARIDGLLDDRFGGHAQLFVDVVCRGADTRMDTAAFGELQRLGRYVDILLHGAREGTDDGARYRLRDLDHRVEVSRTRYREARFDDVHTQFFELPRHLDLLYGVELASRNLLRIAEGGVEDIYFFAHVMRKLGIGTGLRGPMPVRVLGD